MFVKWTGSCKLSSWKTRPIDITKPISWLPMDWRRKVPWYQHPWCWSTCLQILSRFSSRTSTVYWCIASKLKAARNLYWMSNMFLWVEIFLFFVCYHVFPKRHSQLDYELMICKSKGNLTRPDEGGGFFFKYLLWLYYEFGVVWPIGIVPHLIRLGCLS